MMVSHRELPPTLNAPAAPLVSVGIPTFNRSTMLRRAVESVRAQQYPNLEIIISDNASTDDTQQWCEHMAAQDTRVRYFRQPTNVGATANFAQVFRCATGDFHMLLGDDDWLEPSYVGQCSRVLLEQPDVAVACGTPRMYGGDSYLYQGRKMNLLQASGPARVTAYFWQVGENVPFHGLIRRELLIQVPSVPEQLGGDWIFVAWLAMRGKIRTLETTWINKSAHGTTGSWQKVVRQMRLPGYAAQVPYLVIIASVFRDIAWVSPVYAPLGRAGRFALACMSAVVLTGKFSLWSVGVVAKRIWFRFTQRPFPLRAS